MTRDLDATRDEQDGWVRIGRACSNGRRSVWARQKTEADGTYLPVYEVCGGREGDDLYMEVPFEPKSPAAELISMLLWCAET